MKYRQPFVFEIASRTWCIHEFGLDAMFLLEGAEKALLIDTGTGTFDIPAVIETLTDKPIIVAVTHGHLDHIGGMSQFTQIYIHPDDMESAVTCSLEERKAFAAFVLMGSMEHYDLNLECMTDGTVPEMIPIREGDIFRLGGRDVEVYETPGHTPGSVCFLDRKERILFSGDACNPNTLLAFGAEYKPRPKSDVSDLLASAKKIESLKMYYDRNYNGHVGGSSGCEFLPMPECLTRDCIEACEDLLNGKQKGTKESGAEELVPVLWERLGKERADLVINLLFSSSAYVLKHGEVGIKYFKEQVK